MKRALSGAVLVALLLSGCLQASQAHSGIPVVVRTSRMGSNTVSGGTSATGAFIALQLTWDHNATAAVWSHEYDRDQVSFDPGCKSSNDCSGWVHQEQYRTPRLAKNNNSAIYPLNAESHELRLLFPEESWFWTSLRGLPAPKDCTEPEYRQLDLRVLSGDAWVGEHDLIHVWGPATLELEWTC